MIKFLGLLFIFVTLHGAQSNISLPNHHTFFLHQFDKALKGASRILIITHSFNHSELEKKVLKKVKKGATATLIVHDVRGGPLSMVQYDRLNLFTTSVPLPESTILIDETFACTLPGSVSEEDFSSKHALIRCNDDQKKIRIMHHALRPLMKSAKPYLE